MITAEEYLAACWYQPEEMPYPSCYCRRFRRHYEGSVKDTILTFDLQSDSVTIVGVNSQAYKIASEKAHGFSRGMKASSTG